jgi:hypothetical protein
MKRIFVLNLLLIFGFMFGCAHLSNTQKVINSNEPIISEDEAVVIALKEDLIDKGDAKSLTAELKNNVWHIKYERGPRPWTKDEESPMIILFFDIDAHSGKILSGQKGGF